jgi:hypothetical protein
MIEDSVSRKDAKSAKRTTPLPLLLGGLGALRESKIVSVYLRSSAVPGLESLTVEVS